MTLLEASNRLEDLQAITQEMSFKKDSLRQMHIIDEENRRLMKELGQRIDDPHAPERFRYANKEQKRFSKSKPVPEHMP